MKQVRIRDIYDVVDALNDLDEGQVALRKRTKSLGKAGLCFSLSLLLFGWAGLLQEKEIQRLKASISTNRIHELQDQLDTQEEKILKLELELEDLKKG